MPVLPKNGPPDEGFTLWGQTFSGASGTISLDKISDERATAHTWFSKDIEVPGAPIPALAGARPYLYGEVEAKAAGLAESTLKYEWLAGAGEYKVTADGTLGAEVGVTGYLAGGVRWQQAVGAEGAVKAEAKVVAKGAGEFTGGVRPGGDLGGSINANLGVSGTVEASGALTVWWAARQSSHSMEIWKQPIASLSGGEVAAKVDLNGANVSLTPTRVPTMRAEIPNWMMKDESELTVDGKEVELDPGCDAADRQEAIRLQQANPKADVRMMKPPNMIKGGTGAMTPKDAKMLDGIKQAKIGRGQWGGQLEAKSEGMVEAALREAGRAMRAVERSERAASFRARWADSLKPHLIHRGASETSALDAHEAWWVAIVELSAADSAANARAIRASDEAVRVGRDAAFRGYWEGRRSAIRKQHPGLDQAPRVWDMLRHEYRVWYVDHEGKGPEPAIPDYPGQELADGEGLQRL